MINEFVYTGRKTQTISFPLGGIGSGCIGLAGNGSLIEWEIMNRPAKFSNNGFSHFAIKAEKNGEVIDARVLNGDLQPPYIGSGYGTERSTMAGVPHFPETVFKGAFPLAEVEFKGADFPGKVLLDAFNPFIPLNDKDSSIPAAFFEVNIENNTEDDLDYTVVGTISNPFGGDDCINRFDGNKIVLSGGENDITIATDSDSDSISYQEYWFRGSWFDSLGVYWRELTAAGKFKNRHYDKPSKGDTAVLAVCTHVKSGEKGKVRFVISWNVPYYVNYWNPPKEGTDRWKNYYATIFENSSASADYSLKEWDRLYSETKLFKDALFSSTLPDYCIDAISANISILKSPTCVRLTDGSFYGWEGCGPNHGSCEGSCTHVWNYAYALPYLFPKLERSMRDLDYKYNQNEYGSMSFRLQLPLGREISGFRACCDGQFGGVMKIYREWKISGDTEWLKSMWAGVRKSIEFAWNDGNYDKWDADMDGVLEGRQHHTLDMELFGPNSWLEGFYLGALKAGAELADAVGDTEAAVKYRELFAKGKEWTDKNLFNGEYYQQIIDIRDKSLLYGYDDSRRSWNVPNGVVATYWNDEAGEIKYQIADGCIIDQVLAQWHSNLMGLGEIFDNKQVKSALRAIYKYNFKKSMRNVFNACRLYSLNDEAGLSICDWADKYKPVVPITYAEETMNGFEYQAAIHMIQEGMVDEGLECIKAVRDRYDGERRNPWNEFECGSNYARSMASYAILLTFSGFSIDMTKKYIGFNPICKGDFTTFWSSCTGWGTLKIKDGEAEFKVLYGSIELDKLEVCGKSAENVKLETGKSVSVSLS